MRKTKKTVYLIVSFVCIILFFVLFTIATDFHNIIQQQYAAELFPNLPDTTNNLHLGLAFDYNTTPAQMAGKVDYVWGTEWAGTPAGDAYYTMYIPYDSDEDTTDYPQAHNLSWFKTNHPDWIEYKCDKKTVAFEFGDTNAVPLDFTNPAVLNYYEQTYIIPALQPGGGYNGIAFDQLNFENAGDWTGQRCGHFDTNGNWVAQFNGTADDPAYRQAIITWAQIMHQWIHTNFPQATMAVNFSYDFDYPIDTQTLLSNVDIDDDEQGFTNGNNAPPWYYADGQWLEKAQFLQQYLANGQHGWFTVNQEPVAFNQVTNAQVQWVLANYMLLKNNASYFYIAGYQQYGSLNIRPEYSAQVGYALGPFYSSQNVYMRDYSNGKAIVNPSSTQTYTVTLPTGVYQDLYGNQLNQVTLAPISGIVLLGTTPVSLTPSPSIPVTPTATLSPTLTLTPTASPTPSPTPQQNLLGQDTFYRANQNYWGIASDGQKWAGDANSSTAFSISNNTGIMKSNSAANLNAVLGLSTANAQVVFSGKISSFGSGQNTMGAALRWTNSSNFYRAFLTGSALTLQKVVGGKITNLKSVSFSAFTNTLYTIRFNVSGTTLSAKAWKSGTTEPGNWMVTTTDSSLSSGYAGLRMYQQGGVTATITSFQAFKE